MKKSYCITRKLTKSKLAILDASWIEGMLYINRINVPRPYRHLGHGSSMLHEMCQIADREDLVLHLHVAPDMSGEGLNFRQLNDWYGRNGFIGLGEMTRYPRSLHDEKAKRASLTSC